VHLDVRPPLLLVVTVIALAPAAAFAAAPPRAVLPADALESALLAELNVVRAANGLRPLRLDVRLSAAADKHSLEMVESGYFGHESSDGSVFWKRIKQFYRPRVRPGTWAVGENLLWQAPSVSARAAVRAWLRSLPHRENLLNPSYRDVGIAAVRAIAAPGVYGFRRVTVLTVDFGAR